MEDDKQKKTLTETANDTFSLDLVGSSVPAVAGTNDVAVAGAAAGGLTYQTATADEQKKMDAIIAGIDLQNPETVVNLGAQERVKLANLADEILNSIQPSVKMAFVEALKNLLDVIKDNSIDNIKKRIGDTRSSFAKAFGNLFKSEARDEKRMRKMIENFMTDISTSRKTINEMTDKLQAQQVELNKNYDRINQLGAAIVQAAQDMRIVRAASSEYIRRVEAGEITILKDLQEKATATGRADDIEKLQVANANWNNLRVVDGDLLASIGVYDMNVANLAFTKQANLQNRMQTATALTTTIAEWKTQLSIFAIVTTETAAAKLLDSASELTKQSVKKNQELFDTLVDLQVGRAAKGTYSLRQIIESQSAMASKLEGIGDKIEANFAQLASDKKALEESTAAFKKSTVDAYKSKGGFLNTKTPGL